MLRLTLTGRSARVLRPHELAGGVRSLMQEENREGHLGALDLEWITPAGVVLDRRRYGSLEELAFMLPSVLADGARRRPGQ